MKPLLELERKEKLEFDRNQYMEEEKEGDGSEAKKRKMEGGDNTSEENDEESNLFHMKQVYWGKI